MLYKYLTSLTDEERASFKTEKQWIKLGFVPKSQDSGILMYPNRNYHRLFWYYASCDVRPATEEELNRYREKTRERQKIYLEKKKKEKRRQKRKPSSATISFSLTAFFWMSLALFTRQILSL